MTTWNERIRSAYLAASERDGQRRQEWAIQALMAEAGLSRATAMRVLAGKSVSTETARTLLRVPRVRDAGVTAEEVLA